MAEGKAEESKANNVTIAGLTSRLFSCRPRRSVPVPSSSPFPVPNGEAERHHVLDQTLDRG